MIIKILSAWFMAGLLSWIFVYLTAIFSKSLFSHSPSMMLRYKERNECKELVSSMTDIKLILIWMIKGPLLMISVVKLIINAFKRKKARMKIDIEEAAKLLSEMAELRPNMKKNQGKSTEPERHLVSEPKLHSSTLQKRNAQDL